MLLSLTLAALMATGPSLSDLEPMVSAFVDGLRRDDRLAVRGRRPLRHSLGTSYDRLQLLDDITIDWYRLHSVEPYEDDTYVVTVEMEGTATVANTKERVPWPRWWSIQTVRNEEGRWVVDTAMMIERRLAEIHALGPPAALDQVLRDHPEVDIDPFTYFVADHASYEDNAGCGAILWILRLADERNDASLASLAYQMLSTLATTDPGDKTAALLYAERGLEFARADRRPDTIADSYFILGEAYRYAGRDDDAVRAFLQSASYYDRSFDPRVSNRAVNAATEIETKRNNLRAALEYAQLYATMLAGRNTSQHDRMLAAFQIGVIHDRLGNIEIARNYYLTALDVAYQKHDPDWKASLGQNLAMYSLAMGDVGDALIRLEEAKQASDFSVETPLAVGVRTALAAVRRESGDFDGAEAMLAAALNPPRPAPPEVFAPVYVQRSVLRLLEGRLDEALADARIAHETAGAPTADALTAEARALRALQRFDEAEEALRTAIDVVELELSQRPLDEIGLSVVLQQQLEPYRELLDLFVEGGCPREALTVAERMRARSLRDSLRNGRIDLSAGLDADKRARERELESAIALVNRKVLAARNDAEVARLERERDAARLALRRFRSELYVLHPQLDRRRPETSEQYDTWRPLIGGDEIVIELAVSPEVTYLFVLEGDDIAVHRIPIRRAELEKKIDAFVAAIEQRDLAYRKPAQALYELLLGPIETRLASAKSLRIVPDGALWRLPFHALIDARGRHVTDRVPVSYSPSLALTRTPVMRRGAARTLLAFADPAIHARTEQATRSLYRDVTLGRLPEAAKEARAIARLYGDARVRVGADARETAFKDDAPAFRVLHLATHSIVDDRAPMYSSIVLASSDANPLEDGLLEVREIADMKLSADLAVLSACETARGAVTTGEGVVGLSWAFLAAGVPTTVVSQWKVGSASTADLMIRFHRRLHDGAEPAEALRASMIDLRADPRWQHPFYWAPFVVIENSGIPSERQ